MRTTAYKGSLFFEIFQSFEEGRLVPELLRQREMAMVFTVLMLVIGICSAVKGLRAIIRKRTTIVSKTLVEGGHAIFLGCIFLFLAVVLILVGGRVFLMLLA